MNTTIFIYIAAALAAVAAVALVLIVASVSSHGRTDAGDDGVSISADSGSIVTVRKIGRTTRVDIRRDLHDHWEGQGGIDLQPVGIETTRSLEPELFAEYMSPKTSATRKYEIVDYIYSIGLSLPHIRGLNEQWLREQEALRNPATEHTPVDPSGGTTINGIVYRELEVDPRLREEPLPEFGESGQGEEPSGEGEQTQADYET